MDLAIYCSPVRFRKRKVKLDKPHAIFLAFSITNDYYPSSRVMRIFSLLFFSRNAFHSHGSQQTPLGLWGRIFVPSIFLFEGFFYRYPMLLA